MIDINALNEFTITCNYMQDLSLFCDKQDCWEDMWIQVTPEQKAANIYWPTLGQIVELAQKHIDEKHHDVIVVNISERKPDFPVDYVIGPSVSQAVSLRAKELGL